MFTTVFVSLLYSDYSFIHDKPRAVVSGKTHVKFLLLLFQISISSVLKNVSQLSVVDPQVVITLTHDLSGVALLRSHYLSSNILGQIICTLHFPAYLLVAITKQCVG